MPGSKLPAQAFDAELRRRVASGGASEADIGAGKRYPYIRVAHKDPRLDNSVVGWASNSVQIEQTPSYEPYSEDQDSGAIIDDLIERGIAVPFTTEQLDQAFATDSVDELPQLVVDGVATFEVDDLGHWVEEHVPDLQRMGYLDDDGSLVEPGLRVWALNGEERDTEDMEGVYVRAEEAADITSLALYKIQELS